MSIDRVCPILSETIKIRTIIKRTHAVSCFDARVMCKAWCAYIQGSSFHSFWTKSTNRGARIMRVQILMRMWRKTFRRPFKMNELGARPTNRAHDACARVCRCPEQAIKNSRGLPVASQCETGHARKSHSNRASLARFGALPRKPPGRRVGAYPSLKILVFF